MPNEQVIVADYLAAKLAQPTPSKASSSIKSKQKRTLGRKKSPALPIEQE